MTPLSILDLAPVTVGSTPAQTFANALDLARAGERLGYRRYWLAEHHNMPGIASAATAVLIGHVAAGTLTGTAGVFTDTTQCSSRPLRTISPGMLAAGAVTPSSGIRIAGQFRVKLALLKESNPTLIGHICSLGPAASDSRIIACNCAAEMQARSCRSGAAGFLGMVVKLCVHRPGFTSRYLVSWDRSLEPGAAAINPQAMADSAARLVQFMPSPLIF